MICSELGLLISPSKNWVGIVVDNDSLTKKIVDQLIRLIEEQHEINRKKQRYEQIFRQRSEQCSLESKFVGWEDERSNSLTMIDLLFQWQNCFSVKNANSHDQFPWSCMKLNGEESFVETRHYFCQDLEKQEIAAET